MLSFMLTFIAICRPMSIEFCFFKQKTAYEMRISDWSSDVCSSDLPKHQKLGADLLFWALILVVVGSFAGNYFAIAQEMPDGLGFWLGHQGYEFLDLGRIWQIALFAGLLLDRKSTRLNSSH